MAINKNFVVKHGLEVNDKLILADADTGSVGIATTVASYTLHVNGGIGATDLKVGVATVSKLVLTGTVSASSSVGSTGQYLKSTGTGVAWEDFPVGRTSATFTASPGQTTFSFTYSVGLIDVFINGVKLTPSEFTATDAVSIILSNACFGGEIVDIHAYSVRGLGVGATGITGLTIQDEGTLIGNPQGITSINFVGVGLTASATGAAVTVSLLDQWNTTTVGIHTLKNVGIGTTNPRFSLEVGPVGYADTALWVNGNARITGILTVGTSSIILDGSTNTLTVPNLVVTNSTSGVTAAGVAITIRDGGGNLGSASIIDFGDNLSVNLSSGIATITGSAAGGTSSQWVTTAAGIHTLSNVGIGTTNPTSALTVKGNTSLETLNVSGIATFAGSNVKINSGNSLDFGTGAGDLHIYRQSGGGSDSIIKYDGSFSFKVLSDITALGSSDGSITWGVFGNNGVDLYYNNSNKFQTLGTGVTVTGTTFTNQLSVSGISTFGTYTYINDMKVADYQRIYFGDNANLTIGHDTGNSQSLIKNQTADPLVIDLGSNNNSTLTIKNNSTVLSYFSRNNVELYHLNSKKLETIGAGVTVTGTTFTNQLSVSGVSTFTNNINLNTGNLKVATDGIIKIGNSDQLELYYNGGTGQTIKSTGDLRILTNRLLLNNSANDEQLIEANQNGSVALYYDNSKKFETLGTGVTVTGTTFTDQLSVSGVSTFNGPNNYFNGSIICSTYAGTSRTILTGGTGGNTNFYNGGTSYSDFIFTAFQGGASREIARINKNGVLSLPYADGGLNVVGVSTFIGNVGIGTTNATSKLTVRDGDISVGVSTAHGVILTSPNGTQYRLIVDNNGTLSTTAV